MKTKPDWNLYLIRCRDNSLYTGITTDVARRFAEHESNTGAKYLRGRGPLQLVFQKKVGEKRLALGVERKVKNLIKARKEELLTADAGIDALIEQVRSHLLLTVPAVCK